MKRMRVLFGQRRVMVLVTLTVLVLAAAALVASSASFTATSANAGNFFTAGTLTMTNVTGNAPSKVILSAANMRPGDVKTGTVTLSNTGSVPGKFAVTKSALTGSALLAAKLDLVIQEVDVTTGADIGTPKFSAKLNGAFSAFDLGVWPAGATHKYKFTVTWSNSPRDDVADNLLQGTTCSYDFSWDAVADSTIN